MYHKGAAKAGDGRAFCATDCCLYKLLLADKGLANVHGLLL